jgi:hypothetical protein
MKDIIWKSNVEASRAKDLVLQIFNAENLHEKRAISIGNPGTVYALVSRQRRTEKPPSKWPIARYPAQSQANKECRYSLRFYYEGWLCFIARNLMHLYSNTIVIKKILFFELTRK